MSKNKFRLAYMILYDAAKLYKNTTCDFCSENIKQKIRVPIEFVVALFLTILQEALNQFF